MLCQNTRQNSSRGNRADLSPYITVRTGAGGADYARRVLSTSVTTWRYPTALRGLPRPLGRP